jgi:hypothetical protein
MDDIYFTPTPSIMDVEIDRPPIDRQLFDAETIKSTYQNMFDDIIAIIDEIFASIIILESDINDENKILILNLFKKLNNFLHDFDNLDKIIRICFCKYTTLNKSFLYVVLLQLKENLDKLVVIDIDTFIENMVIFKKKSIENKIKHLSNLHKRKFKKEVLLKKYTEILEKYEAKHLKKSTKLLKESSKKSKSGKSDKSTTPGIARIGTIDKTNSNKSLLSSATDIFSKQKEAVIKKIEKAKTALKKYEKEIIKLPGEINKEKEDFDKYIKSQQGPKKSRTKESSEESERAMLERATQEFNTDYRRRTKEDKELNYFKKRIQVAAAANTDMTFRNMLQQINPGSSPSIDQEASKKNLAKLFERHMSTVNSSKTKLRGIQQEGLFIMIVENMMTQLLQNIQGDLKKELDVLIDQIDLVSKSKYRLFGELVKQYYTRYIKEIIPDTDLYARYISNIEYITDLSRNPYKNSMLLKVKYYYEHIFKLLYK